MLVVSFLELTERLAEFVEIAEATDPEQLFLEGAEEAFDAAVAFRLPNERWWGLHSDKADLILKIVAHVDATVVVTQEQARGNASGEGRKVLPDALANRIESFEAIRLFHNVDADAFGGVVIDGGKDRDASVVIGVCSRGVCAPDLIGRGWQNSSSVWMRIGSARGLAVWREQIILSH